MSTDETKLADLPDLDADEICARQAQRLQEIKRIPIPDWGGCVYVRKITARERDRFDLETYELRQQEKDRNITARYAVLTCVKKNGKPMFTKLHEQVLADTCGDALELYYDLAAKFNGMIPRTKEELDELEKNSCVTTAAV